MTIKQLIQWGLKHDPYAPILAVVLPLVVITLALVLP